MPKIDELDMKIMSELVKDASISVPRLSKKINVNASVVYSRIKRLIKLGLIKKYTIIVNEEMLGYNVRAVTGINMDSKMRDNIISGLMKIPEVREIAEVTGRFDILITLTAKTLDEIHHIVSDKIGRLDGVQRTETFIEMKRTIKEPTFSEVVLPLVTK
ncbi:Lrp/AsnC family transcriptional regulator [Candidatus Nitrosocaldus cavascurensis]|jgi:Lrp/AsnC family transcriptional regulator for asnA, asnC and gidA|uniref:Transcriptional regulator n=2 Tax=Candidatus Nitrosocaldus TaxID=498374 RepID=A0A2K5ANX8_9ARCH|nr:MULTISPECIES: Lrp/AsnC family transcriptional regulator [Candidatus Nitrosocaldus]GBC74471.1 Regulatory protein AsnC [archaeon HR05]SPC33342.1 Transcriptional regulator [Candidatus Nitrosocaldus cavascurensis]